MSTHTLAPEIFTLPERTRRQPGSARPAVRLTRRGRLVVLAAFLVVAALLMTAVAGLATATRDAGPAPEVRTVTVAPGDTLYALASEIAGPGEIRETVAEIKRLNSMSGSSLQIGERIALPLG